MSTRVLAVRLDSMGDLLVTGPALRALAARADVDSLTLLCSPASVSTAGLLPGIDRIISWACPWIASPPPLVEEAELRQLCTELGSADIDEAVIFTSFHQSPLPTALLLRQIGIGRITGVSADYPGSLLDERIRPGEELPDDCPEVERGLAIAARAGFPLPLSDDGRPRVRGFSGQFAHQCPDEQRRSMDDQPVVVHPGVSVPARQWSPLHMRETVVALVAEGRRVLVTGTDAERELTSFVAGDGGSDLGGRLDVAGLADALAHAAAVIVGNTGPAHLASAVGTPVVSLFSPVVPPSRWLPYGVDVEMLGDQNAACRGTRARHCPLADHPCLDAVTAEAAVSALHRLLARSGCEPSTSSSRVPTPLHVVRSDSSAQTVRRSS